MKRRTRHTLVGLGILLVGGCLLLAPGGAAQQSPSRTVRGQVLDEKEKVVANAIVHLTNLSTKEHLSVVTDKEGRYQFNDVSMKADFEVYAESGNRKSRVRRLSQFDTRARVTINLTLEPPEASDDSKGAEEKKDGKGKN